VAAWAAALPQKLCALGPANLSAVTASPVAPQLCPLAAAQWVGTGGAGAPGAAATAALARIAAAPETAGGAGVLLVAGSASAAAALQARFCDVFHRTPAACGFALPVNASGAASAHAANASALAGAAVDGGRTLSLTPGAAWAAAKRLPVAGPALVAAVRARNVSAAAARLAWLSLTASKQEREELTGDLFENVTKGCVESWGRWDLHPAQRLERRRTRAPPLDLTPTPSRPPSPRHTAQRGGGGQPPHRCGAGVPAPAGPPPRAGAP
jgi:hypothetical protein